MQWPNRQRLERQRGPAVSRLRVRWVVRVTLTGIVKTDFSTAIQLSFQVSAQYRYRYDSLLQASAATVVLPGPVLMYYSEYIVARDRRAARVRDEIKPFVHSGPGQTKHERTGHDRRARRRLACMIVNAFRR